MEELEFDQLSVRTSNTASSSSNLSEITTHLDGQFGSTVAMVKPTGREKCEPRHLLPPWQASVSALCMVMNSVIIGMALSYTSPALPDMRRSHKPFRTFTAEEESWFASCVALSALIGGLSGGSLSDRFGRQCVAVVLIVPVSFGWLVMAAATAHWHLYVGRLLTGWGAGIAQTVVPMYVAEISPTSHRGLLLSLHALSLNLGALITYVAGAFMSWQSLAVFNIGLCTVAEIGVALIPESPRWLLLKGRRRESIKSLAWLRGRPTSGDWSEADIAEEVSAEVSDIVDSVSTRIPVAGFSELKERRLYHPLLLTLALMAFQIAGGIDVVWFYTVFIFQAASGSSENTNSNLDAFMESIVVGAVAVVGNIMAAAVMDRAGRKPMLVISGIVMSISTAALGTFFYLLEVDAVATKSRLYWLPVLCLVVYLLGFDLAWGPLPSAMTGELLPNRSRGMASSFTVAWLWLGIFLITKFYVNINEVIHACGAFWMFSAFTVAGTVFVVVAIPETKNKSLEEIEKLFQ